jgi:hypothetical protein
MKKKQTANRRRPARKPRRLLQLQQTDTSMIAIAPNGQTADTRRAAYRRNNLRFYSTFRLHLFYYWNAGQGFDREKFAAAAGIAESGDRFLPTVAERYGERAGFVAAIEAVEILRELTAE